MGPRCPHPHLGLGFCLRLLHRTQSCLTQLWGRGVAGELRPPSAVDGVTRPQHQSKTDLFLKPEATLQSSPITLHAL